MSRDRQSLEQRLKIQEDWREIVTLKARYVYACDGFRGGPTHDYDGVAACFTEDGVWDPTPLLPRVVGRQAIRDMIKSHQTMPFAMHNAVNPLIELNGDTATGKFNVIVAVTSAERKAYWVFAHYEDEFVRTQEGWRIKYLRALVDAYAPYETGWGALSPPTQDRHAELTKGS
jgi:SnoaL-like domain